MTAMVRKDFLNEDEKHFSKKHKTDYLKQLKPDDKKWLQEVKTNYGKMNATALMKHTYLNYPFYAIKSEVTEKILNEEELQRVKKANPQKADTVLFTIGYEGFIQRKKSSPDYFSQRTKSGTCRSRTKSKS